MQPSLCCQFCLGPYGQQWGHSPEYPHTVGCMIVCGVVHCSFWLMAVGWMVTILTSLFEHARRIGMSRDPSSGLRKKWDELELQSIPVCRSDALAVMVNNEHLYVLPGSINTQIILATIGHSVDTSVDFVKEQRGNFEF